MHYYNENNREAAAMLRQFMVDGLIPNGDVDERSITEVKPDELKKYTQCHFFAGVAGWQFALQIAGWPEDRPIWTGSCPCQPFSSAGRHKGKEDERHLWPVWQRLISECRPPVIFGEQVATAIAKGWLDDVYEGLESEGYAIGSAVLPASSVGTPHKRERLWFVADTKQSRLEGRRRFKQKREEEGRENKKRYSSKGSFWDGAQWIMCSDGKARPVEPSVPLLVDGFQQRKPILHAVGNAIVPQVAAEFITAFMETTKPLANRASPVFII